MIAPNLLDEIEKNAKGDVFIVSSWTAPYVLKDDLPHETVERLREIDAK